MPAAAALRSSGSGLSRKRGTAPRARRRRRAKQRSPALYVCITLAAVTCLCVAAILWTYVLITAVTNGGSDSRRFPSGGIDSIRRRMGGATSVQERQQHGPRKRNDPEAMARNKQRLIERKLARRRQREEEGGGGGGGGGGGWMGYAQRRREEKGERIQQLAARYHDTHTGLFERINRRRRAYFDRNGDDDQFRVDVGALHLPRPIIVMGMPKSGTTSIFSYFKCGGQRSSHFACNNHFTVNATTEGRRPIEEDEMVKPKPWRNCRLPPGAGGGSSTDEEGENRKKPGLNIDAGDFPLCSVCVERNVLHGRPPLEGCGYYDVWAELDSAEHPLPSLLAKQVAAQKERDAEELAKLVDQVENEDEGEGEGGEGIDVIENDDETRSDGEDLIAADDNQQQEQEILSSDVRPLCSYPQITHLQEIHDAYPNATFILNLRPVDKWVRSVSKWADHKRRTTGGYLRQVLTMCDLPGFPSGVGKTDEELTAFYENHSKRIRDFVKKHPSHSLVEVDIEAENAGRVLEERFGVSHHCWKVRNANPEKLGGGLDAQRARDMYMGGARVLGEGRDRSRRRRERPADDGDELKFRALAGGGLRARDGDIHKRRKRPSDPVREHPDGESEGEEEDKLLHMNREERRRGMRERLKKKLGVLDAWRDRHNYPVCENIEDIFPTRAIER